MHRTTPTLAGLVKRTRPLPFRKQVLFAEHQQLLTTNDLVLFLRPGDFSAQEWRTLRSHIAHATTTPPPSTATNAASSGLKLTLLRPGLLPALLRDQTSGSEPTTLDLTHLSQPSHLSGPLAVVTSPKLSPSVLSKVLKLVAQFSKTPAANAPPPSPNAPPVERLALLSSLLEKRVAASKERTLQVGKLPELDVLRSQLVGLLGMPGSRIVGVVGARAREVGRTVEGFKEGLKSSTTADAPQPEQA